MLAAKPDGQSEQACPRLGSDAESSRSKDDPSRRFPWGWLGRSHPGRQHRRLGMNTQRPADPGSDSEETAFKYKKGEYCTWLTDQGLDTPSEAERKRKESQEEAKAHVPKPQSDKPKTIHLCAAMLEDWPVHVDEPNNSDNDLDLDEDSIYRPPRRYYTLRLRTSLPIPRYAKLTNVPATTKVWSLRGLIEDKYGLCSAVYTMFKYETVARLDRFNAAIEVQDAFKHKDVIILVALSNWKNLACWSIRGSFEDMQNLMEELTTQERTKYGGEQWLQKQINAALIMACYQGNFEIVFELFRRFDHYILLNTRHRFPYFKQLTVLDRLPLHCAIRHGSWKCMCLLMEKGGDIRLHDRKGMTPLMFARKYKTKECLKTLQYATTNAQRGRFDAAEPRRKRNTDPEQEALYQWLLARRLTHQQVDSGRMPSMPVSRSLDSSYMASLKAAAPKPKPAETALSSKAPQGDKLKEETQDPTSTPVEKESKSQSAETTSGTCGPSHADHHTKSQPVAKIDAPLPKKTALPNRVSSTPQPSTTSQASGSRKEISSTPKPKQSQRNAPTMNARRPLTTKKRSARKQSGSTSKVKLCQQKALPRKEAPTATQTQVARQTLKRAASSKVSVQAVKQTPKTAQQETVRKAPRTASQNVVKPKSTKKLKSILKSSNPRNQQNTGKAKRVRFAFRLKASFKSQATSLAAASSVPSSQDDGRSKTSSAPSVKSSAPQDLSRTSCSLPSASMSLQSSGSSLASSDNANVERNNTVNCHQVTPCSGDSSACHPEQSSNTLADSQKNSPGWQYPNTLNNTPPSTFKPVPSSSLPSITSCEANVPKPDDVSSPPETPQSVASAQVSDKSRASSTTRSGKIVSKQEPARDRTKKNSAASAAKKNPSSAKPLPAVPKMRLKKSPSFVVPTKDLPEEVVDGLMAYSERQKLSACSSKKMKSPAPVRLVTDLVKGMKANDGFGKNWKAMAPILDSQAPHPDQTEPRSSSDAKMSVRARRLAYVPIKKSPHHALLEKFCSPVQPETNRVNPLKYIRRGDEQADDILPTGVALLKCSRRRPGVEEESEEVLHRYLENLFTMLSKARNRSAPRKDPDCPPAPPPGSLQRSTPTPSPEPASDHDEDEDEDDDEEAYVKARLMGPGLTLATLDPVVGIPLFRTKTPAGLEKIYNPQSEEEDDDEEFPALLEPIPTEPSNASAQESPIEESPLTTALPPVVHPKAKVFPPPYSFRSHECSSQSLSVAPLPSLAKASAQVHSTERQERPPSASSCLQPPPSVATSMPDEKLELSPPRPAFSWRGITEQYNEKVKQEAWQQFMREKEQEENEEKEKKEKTRQLISMDEMERSLMATATGRVVVKPRRVPPISTRLSGCPEFPAARPLATFQGNATRRKRINFSAAIHPLWT